MRKWGCEWLKGIARSRIAELNNNFDTPETAAMKHGLKNNWKNERKQRTENKLNKNRNKPKREQENVRSRSE